MKDFNNKINQPRVKFGYQIIPTLFTIMLFAACNLQNEVELELPSYTPQPVLECYLEPGVQFNLLLTKSFEFFAPFDTSDGQFLENVIETGAEITIRFDGKEVVLQEGFIFNPFTQKVSNYWSNEIVPEDYENEFELEARLSDGTTITGKTFIPIPIALDSVVIEFESDAPEDTLARALTYFTDPDPTVENRFRRQFHWNNLIDSIPEQDFIASDQFSDDGRIVFGTGFDYPVGDTVFNTIFNLNRDYSDFLESVIISVQSNGNPFGQPSGIDSNLSGTANPLGIFTGLSFARDITIIEK